MEVFNPGTAIIDSFAQFGWAYDLKKAPQKTVRNIMVKSGDIDYKKNSLLTEYFFGISINLIPIIMLLVPKLFYYRENDCFYKLI